MEAIGIFGTKPGSRLSFCSQTNLFPACKLHRSPATSYPRNHAHFVSLKATANPLACEDEENNRNIRKPFPSKWDHQSLFGNLDFSQMDAIGREIEALKPQVRNMFISSKGIKKKFLFTYLLVTLGVAYHFEDEIVETLKDGFQKIEEMMAGEDDLYTVSVIFYVFRTYGYNISSDVFGRFLGDHGEFKKCLTRDAKGILSLYEAAHMGTTTDYILDEALTFTLSNLESLSCTCKPNLSRLIRNSLGLPQHKNMEILVAKEFIRFYEKEEDSDLTLLKFSKLNFKFLQLLYLQELKILSKWYKEQDFESKLPPYYRDILVELNLHTLTYLEPKYSRVRIFLTKFYVMQVIVDDTCDRYASLREVEILAHIFERWDLDDHAMDRLPDYLKSVVEFVIGTFQEFERELGSELGAVYSMEATIEYFKRYMRSNLQLAKWASVDYLPSFQEYLDVAGLEIALDFTLACVLMAMKNICKEEAYEWLKCRDKLNKAIATKARVFNDMFGYEDDMNRGYLTGSVNCYKKQYGVTEEEAFRKLHQLIAEYDKMMNEEILKPINVPRQVLKVVMIDTLRAVNVAYNKQDGFTRPDGHLKNITSMLVDL
ncbi:terpenoid synthase 28-like isoform X1 [Brassica napus]|uniref:terpenoid synthase 28-like isoform X1 n=1 Tax=Brassica napus TaxID=3708 RepID=UPI0020787892|nr:terpenoid synthase 28-like isoform X1 [Brassica napus]